MPRGNCISRKTKYRKNHQTGRLQTDYLLSCQVVYLCRQPLDAGRRFSYGVSIIPDDYDPIAYVVSKSMEAKIRNSDYLFIKNTPQIDIIPSASSKQTALTMSRNSAKATSKKLNPEYPDIHLDESNHIRTIGKVVRLYREN